MVRSLLKKNLAVLIVLIMAIGLLPINALAESVEGSSRAPSDPDSGTKAQIYIGNGIWITGKLTYSYTVTTDPDNTKGGAAGSVEPDGNTITVKATSAKPYTSGSGCNSTTVPAAATTTAVTVTNSSGNYLKVTSLSSAGEASVSGITQGATLAPNATFSISVTSPADGENNTDKTGTVTIVVEEASINNLVTFLPPQTIDGNVPGSYTITKGDSTLEPGTYESTVLTLYTLTASTNSGYIFNGWIVNGKRVSTNTTFTSTFIEETNTVFPDYITSGIDPLAKIAVLNSSDTSISKFDVADYYSFYEPSDYQQAGNNNNYNTPSSAAKLGSYEGKRNNTDNQWPNDNLPNVDWTASTSTSSMTASRSSTAYGDNGPNAAGSAKTNAKVLRIKAKQTIKISFDYTVTETYDVSGSKDGSARQIAFFYSLISSSDAPLLATLKSGTRWGGDESGNSGNNTYTGTFEETIEAGQYLYLYFFGYGYNYRTGSNAFAYSFNSTVSDVVIEPVTESYSVQSGCIDGAGNMIGSGKLTINNTDYTVASSGMTITLSDVNEGSHISFAVKTVPNGYTHIGWRVISGGTTQDVFSETYGVNVGSNITVYALFSPKIIVTAGSNGFEDATYSSSPASTGSQYIARSSDGFRWYRSLDAAFSAEEIVVLVTNVDFNGRFTYAIGETAKADSLTEDPEIECGHGIHMAHKSWCVSYGRSWPDLAILELEADASGVVVPLNGAGKVRAAEAKVLREVPLEECGLLGKVLARRYMEAT